uniref:Uncharacterized protein n=1 Tax=Rhizophora mucronata TaxID=61149 RepID=A0A2P2P1E7_RHIMU
MFSKSYSQFTLACFLLMSYIVLFSYR